MCTPYTFEDGLTNSTAKFDDVKSALLQSSASSKDYDTAYGKGSWSKAEDMIQKAKTIRTDRWKAFELDYSK